jgi:arsenite-transporting ATPase
MTQYLFFSGKGGVGKTTMACATAVHYATEGRATLIVTTDPASNLADVFEQEIGSQIKPIRSIEHLFAVEIDSDDAAREYREGIIGPMREMMPDDLLSSLEENLSGPCTTELASFDKFIDFMGRDEYEVIIFDTAPTGHTIRLLELPVDWSKHIDESARGSGQTCIGPVQSIQDSKEKYDRAMTLLADTDRTTFIFVMRPDALSLYETIRASKELETIGIRSGNLIINGILPNEVCELDFFRTKFEAQEEVIEETKRRIGQPKRYMLLRDNEIKGIDALKGVAEELFNGTRPTVRTSTDSLYPKDGPAVKPDTLRLWSTNGDTKALFFIGKGGVGKTTISCVAALKLAAQGFKTLLVTTDPASHIGQVLDVEVGNEPRQINETLYAVLVDQKAAFAEYKQKILNDARGKYSDDMIQAMEEELNSPCTEEMAAFDKFVQFIESRDFDLIVFDTAPTGHTLRLLDLPFDYAKQVEMMAGTAETIDQKETTQNRFKEIISILRDENRAVFNLVLYPESTPIMESYRTMLDLKNASIETQLVIANMVLPSESCTNPFFKNRRAMQMKYLKEIEERFSLPVLQFPMMREELRGLKQLQAAVSNL